MVEAPEKIWLSAPDEVWFEDSEGSTEYLRSDIAERQIAELRAERDKLLTSWAESRERHLAAEAENARLKALPLKDEVEMAKKQIILAMQMYDFGRIDENGDFTCSEAQIELLEQRAEIAAREILSRLRATPEAVSPSDPSVILAGIKQFGLASDGSDLRDLEAAIDRLRAGEQEGWRTECATEGCDKPATIHFERGGIGSYYCHDCYLRIQALPASPSVSEGGSRNG